MKKVIFIAVIVSLFTYLGCNKAEQHEQLATDAIEQVAGSGNENQNGLITTRANCGGALVCPCDCCCGLTLDSPTSTDIDIEICGDYLGCFGTGTYNCEYGGGNCGNVVTMRQGGSTTLNTNGNPTKIFCSGGTGDTFRVTNLSGVTARFTIECGGSSSNLFTLLAGESALIRKGTDCDIDPADPCIY